MFAERGFDVSTPDLARHMGIAQSLLYKYYADKEELLKAAYLHITPAADFYDTQCATLSDRSVPLAERLNRFYRVYADTLWNYRRVKLQMWANLKYPESIWPYLTALEERIYPTIALELRASLGLSTDAAPSEAELEIVRAFHGMMYHMAGVRRWIHRRSRPDDDMSSLVDLYVSLFLKGAEARYRGQK